MFQNIRNKWNHKTKRTRLIIKMTILLEATLFFFLYLNAIPYWKELTQVKNTEAQIVQIEKPIVLDPMPDTVKDTLDYYADTFGVSKDLVYKIVKCESNFETDRNGDGQLNLFSRGLFQFRPQTFFQYASLYKVKNADINDYRDQTIVAVQMLRDGQCKQWTCCPK